MVAGQSMGVIHLQRMQGKTCPTRSGLHIIVWADSEGEEPPCNIQVYLYTDELSWTVAPSDGSSEELPPSHVVLLPTVLVPTHPAPPLVLRVELHSEPTAVG